MHSLHPMVLSRTEAERSDVVRNLKELFVSSSEFCVGHHPFRESFPLYSIMSDCEGLPMGEYSVSGNSGFILFLAWPHADNSSCKYVLIFCLMREQRF